MAHHEHETRTRDDAATLPLPIEFEVSEPPVPPLRCWILAAYWSGGFWRIWSNQWNTREAAERAAADLPSDWQHRTVLRVEVPQ